MLDKILPPLLVALVPTIVLILGGQYVLNMYSIQRARREKELDLLKAVREKQYEAIQMLYNLFSEFMKLYRLSTPKTGLVEMQNEEARKDLVRRAVDAEVLVDALVLRVGVEFGSLPEKDARDLSAILGNLRQSVQVWRETLREGRPVEFGTSKHPDYVRFKQCFARTASFLVRQMYCQFNVPVLDEETAWSIVCDAFDNKHEILKSWESVLLAKR